MTTTVFNTVVERAMASNETTQQVNKVPNIFSKHLFGRTAYITSAAQFLMVAAIVSSVLRVFSRRRTKARFMLDDACAVVAALLLAANTVIFVQFHSVGSSSFSLNGASTPGGEVQRRKEVVMGLKLSFVFEVLYLLTCIFLVKFSILFLYDRFARQTKGIILYLRITQGICAATFIACILSLLLSCRPISNYWSLTQTNDQCSKRMLLTYAPGISNIVTNTLVLAVPVPLLLRITLKREQKIGLSILYFFGAAVIMTSALRFVTQLLNVSTQQAMGWSQMEVSLALLLASAPMAIKLLLTPLLLDAEVHARARANGTMPPATAALDTPMFMKRLLSERDAITGGVGGGETPARIGPRRLVHEENNGQSVWGVRPISPVSTV